MQTTILTSDGPKTFVSLQDVLSELQSHKAKDFSHVPIDYAIALVLVTAGLVIEEQAVQMDELVKVLESVERRAELKTHELERLTQELVLANIPTNSVAH